MPVAALSTCSIIESIFTIYVLTSVVLVIVSFSIPATCNRGNETLHLLETVSNLFFLLPAIYAGWQRQLFTCLQLLGILIASTLYHLCDQIDDLSCPGICLFSIYSLYYLDLTMAALLIYLVGFYKIPAMQESLLQQLLLVLIPLVLGGIYTAVTPDLTTSGFDTLTIIVYTLIGVVAIGVLLFRITQGNLKWPHSHRSGIFLALTVFCAITALVVHLLQSQEGYGFSHWAWHIGGAMAVFFYMLFIDEKD